MPSSGSAGTFDNLLGDRLLRTSEMPLVTAACVLPVEGIYPNNVAALARSCASRPVRRLAG